MHIVSLRAWQSVDISKQNILQQVSVALQLPIYKVHTIEEKFSVYRGCIEMAILAENIFGYQEPKTFYGDTTHTEYHAVENAAEEALLFLADHHNVTVRDLNHHKMARAVRNKYMAESFQDHYKDTFQA